MNLSPSSESRSGQDLGGRRGLALRLVVDRAPQLRGRGVDAPDVHDFAEGAVLLGYAPLVERKRVRLLVGLLSGDVLPRNVDPPDGDVGRERLGPLYGGHV